MHLKSVQLRSFKRFLDSGEIAFSPGLNVMVGPNNVGKTSIVDAICGWVQSAPHRSLATMRRPADSPPPSQVALTAYLSAEEVKSALSPVARVSVPRVGDLGTTLNFLARLGDSGATVTFDRGSNIASVETLPLIPAGPFEVFDIKMSGGDLSFGYHGSSGTIWHPYIGDVLKAPALAAIYGFRAERPNIGSCRAGVDTILKSDASNLPEVLQNLRSTTNRFDRFVGHVIAVLPHITDITVAPITTDQVRINVWEIDKRTDRDDLATPLADCGTGVGQVLAMLYVASAARGPRIIVIDEPHSFLHPGAVRKLLGILLTEYPQHQYIVSTNSPIAILSSSPATVHLIERRGSESVVRPVDVSATSEMTAFLDAVGADLSDVFGADRILWVEGRTEERCFPLLLSKYAPTDTPGLLVRGVVHTGDLESKDAKRIFHIYRQVSSGASLMPPAVAFVFDREDRTEAQRAELVAASQGSVRFLARKMYENYLLSPKGIAQVLRDLDVDNAATYDEQRIETAIAEACAENAKLSKGAPPGVTLLSDDWKANVHGADLLSAVFGRLTDHRIAYDKVRHGIALTTAVLEFDFPDVKSLAIDELSPLLSKRAS